MLSVLSWCRFGRRFACLRRLYGTQDEVTAELRATAALTVLRKHAATRPLTLTFCKLPTRSVTAPPTKVVAQQQQQQQQEKLRGTGSTTTIGPDHIVAPAVDEGKKTKPTHADFQRARLELISTLATTGPVASAEKESGVQEED